jgi:hypothetical protein
MTHLVTGEAEFTQRMSSRIEAMGLPVFHSLQESVPPGTGLCRAARQRS